MTANRGSGTAAKFLAAIYAVLWLAVIVYVVVTRDRYQPAHIDLSGWRILIAAAGFESAVLFFLTLLKHYGKHGHTPLSQAAVICAFFSNLCVIIPLPCFFITPENLLFGVMFGYVLYIVIYILLIASAALLFTSIILLIISRVKDR